MNMVHVSSAEEDLRISIAALAAISQGVVITRADQLIISTNTAFSRITQYPVEEILNKNCRFLQGPLTDQKTVAKIRSTLQEGKEFSGEIMNYRKDGTTFWNDLTITPIVNEQGVISHFVGVTRDITLNKNLQDELSQQLKETQKMNKLMIDREIKMTELKNEISDLKKRLGFDS